MEYNLATTHERGELRIDGLLSGIAIDYYQAKHVLAAGEALPYALVDKDSGKYPVFDKQNFRSADTAWRPGMSANKGSSYNSDLTGTYSCVKHKWTGDVTNDELKQADKVIQPMVRVTKKTKDVIMNGLEQTIVDKLTDSSSTFSSYSAAASYGWDTANATIVSDVQTAKSSIRKNTGGMEANVGIIGSDDFDTLIENAEIKDKIKHTWGKSITVEMVAAMFQLDKLIVHTAVNNTTDEGVAATMAYMWDGKMTLLYVPKAPSIYEPSCGYIVAEKLYGGKNVRVRKFRDGDETKETTIIEVTASYDVVVMAAEAGYVITGI